MASGPRLAGPGSLSRAWDALPGLPCDVSRTLAGRLRS